MALPPKAKLPLATKRTEKAVKVPTNKNKKTAKAKSASSAMKAAKTCKPVRKIVKVTTVRLRISGKSAPLLIKVVKGFPTTRSTKEANPSIKQALRRVVAKPQRLHLLLERRWLGLGEKAQKSALGRRGVAGGAAAIEGWGIRVLAVCKNKANAERALAAALKKQSEVEREGALRERAQLMVRPYEIATHEGGSKSEPGHQTCVNGSTLRHIYTVSSCIGESFSSEDLPQGLVGYQGNFFFMSDEAEVAATKSEEERGTPWGYPHNASLLCSMPGQVLKIFSSPVGEVGANAYATGNALQDLQVPGFMSLADQDLTKAITYSGEDGLVQVRMHRAEKKGCVRVLLTVQKHAILDCRSLSRTGVHGGS